MDKDDIYRRHCDECPPVGIKHCVEFSVFCTLFLEDKGERGKDEDLKHKVN